MKIIYHFDVASENLRVELFALEEQFKIFVCDSIEESLCANFTLVVISFSKVY